MDTVWFLVKFGLGLILALALLHAFVTHLIILYEMRLHQMQTQDKHPIPWIYLGQSVVIEAFCNLIRSLLTPFATLNASTISKKDSTPILLVHGYLQNQTDWLWVKHQLKKMEGIGSLYSLNLCPPFESITQYSELLKHKIEAIQRETQHPKIILIGHSMGGLVCSYYNEYMAKDNEVSMVIAIGSPYQGTRLSALGYGQNVKEMAPHSDFLKSLSERMQHTKTPYYFIASKIDNLISPWNSALPIHMGTNIADNSLVLNDHGHLRLLISPKVIHQIAAWINKA